METEQRFTNVLAWISRGDGAFFHPSASHHELAREALLREGVALGQGGEEPTHALVLLQGAVALEGLLNQPPQLLWLSRNSQKHPEFSLKVRYFLVTWRGKGEDAAWSWFRLPTFMLVISSLGKNRSSPTSFLNETASVKQTHLFRSTQNQTEPNVLKGCTRSTYSNSSKLDFFSSPFGFMSL